MTSKSMRSFAGGLLVATGLCGAVYFFGPSEATSTQTTEQLSKDEMKDLLSSEGYVVHTEKEWKEQLAEAKSSKDKAGTEAKAETQEKIVYRTVLRVSKGMTSIDVGKALQRARVIKSGQDFFNEVEKSGVENHLRPGTYVVQSDMTTEEIISVIFK
ncbi:hypothetical protein D1953_00870 [Peribacillus asahii]|uniref:Aminodeoxychorismate lyase n=1 Tax=Peribacillus asahii TaxID=228899 RepID=A0A398BFW3_9BACI|nr:hypothetical protein [Peribacillus asahii]RID89155.1 hypothetical protein D1953_00870 [Peribacillus asahii]